MVKLNELVCLFHSQKYKNEASRYEKYRRLRMARHQENWFAAAGPDVATGVASKTLEREVRKVCYFMYTKVLGLHHLSFFIVL